MGAGINKQSLGRMAIASGVIGAAVGVLTLAYPAAVSEETWSHPFPFGVGLAVAVVLALAHALTGAGYHGVRLVVGTGDGARTIDIALRVAIAGFALLSIAELASGAIGREADDSSTASAVAGLFGIASLLIGVSSLVAGFAGGSRQSARALIPRWPLIAAGAILLLLVTPMQIAGSFDLANIALILWSLTFVPLGAALLNADASSPGTKTAT